MKLNYAELKIGDVVLLDSRNMRAAITTVVSRITKTKVAVVHAGPANTKEVWFRKKDGMNIGPTTINA